MYKLSKSDSQTILQNVRKDGTVSDILSVYHTLDKNVIVVDKNKKDSYIIKSDNPLKFAKSGNNYIATFEGSIGIYKKPHYIAYHNEVLLSNRSMLHMSSAKFIPEHIRDNLQVDYDGILDNMLEFIANI